MELFTGQKNGMNGSEFERVNGYKWSLLIQFVCASGGGADGGVDSRVKQQHYVLMMKRFLPVSLIWHCALL